MELIFDVKRMTAAVVEMEFDIKKMPLGKLTKEQIQAGYQTLKDIDEAISVGSRPVSMPNIASRIRNPNPISPSSLLCFTHEFLIHLVSGTFLSGTFVFH